MISDVIRFHRKSSGLNQNELAKLAGVGKTAVFDLEHSKPSIRLDTLIKVLTVSLTMPLRSEVTEIPGTGLEKPF